VKRYKDDSKNLEILAEECAEVIQIKSKITRFGLQDRYPSGGKTNQERLEEEIGHVFAMVDVLMHRGIVTEEGVEAGRVRKLVRLEGWY